MENQRTLLPDDKDSGGLAAYGTLLVLPVCFAGVAWLLRAEAGPMWQFNLLDPAYFYLLDALNLLNGDPPGHIYHPGVTVQSFGALMIALKGLFSDGTAVAGALADPEAALRWMSSGFILLNATALFVLGVVALRVLGEHLPALVCQLAPFMSTIVAKHAFLPRPESMLVFATLALMTLAVAALRVDLDGKGRARLAAGFGVVAGFTLATKFTAAPVLILPFFVLRGWRPALIYAGVGIAAFIVFFAPAMAALDAVVEWVGRIATTTGPHGSGASGIINWDAYPGAVAKILKRASIRVPLILSVCALAVTWLRARRGADVAVGAIWVVVGVGVAQLAHALFVGKQPNAFYMIPSYMLAALSVLFSIRLLRAARPGRLHLPMAPGIIGALAFAVFVAAQTAGLERLYGEFADRREAAGRIDNETFKSCARVYIYGASSPTYALFLANKLTGRRFTEALKKGAPENDFWIDDWWAWEPIEFKDWDGLRDFSVVRADYPCVYIRGFRPTLLRKFLAAQPGGVAAFDFACRAGLEEIALSGIDCRGRRQ